MGQESENHIPAVAGAFAGSLSAKPNECFLQETKAPSADPETTSTAAVRAIVQNALSPGEVIRYVGELRSTDRLSYSRKAAMTLLCVSAVCILLALLNAFKVSIPGGFGIWLLISLPIAILGYGQMKGLQGRVLAITDLRTIVVMVRPDHKSVGIANIPFSKIKYVAKVAKSSKLAFITENAVNGSSIGEGNVFSIACPPAIETEVLDALHDKVSIRETPEKL
jgi:hypothetical protein